MTHERRQFSRVTQPFEARYRLVGELGASWLPCTTINLSAGGMRIRSAEALPVDGALELEISLPSAKERCTLQGRVLWNQMHASGVIESGIEFVRPAAVQQEQIDGLVRFLHQHEQELRES